MTQRSTIPTWLLQPVDSALEKALRLAAVPIWLAGSVLVAILTLFVPAPDLVANILFFGPQYLFDYSLVVRPNATGSGFVRLFPDGAAALACVAFWLTVTIGHAVIARRWKLSRAIAAGLVSVVVASVLVHLAFAAFGYTVQLDGP